MKRASVHRSRRCVGNPYVRTGPEDAGCSNLAALIGVGLVSDPDYGVFMAAVPTCISHAVAVREYLSEVEPGKLVPPAVWGSFLKQAGAMPVWELSRETA